MSEAAIEPVRDGDLAGIPRRFHHPWSCDAGWRLPN